MSGPNFRKGSKNAEFKSRVGREFGSSTPGAPRPFEAQFDSECLACGTTLERGQRGIYDEELDGFTHADPEECL